MAIHTGVLQEDLLALDGGEGSWCRRRLLQADPSVELIRRLGDDENPHPGMFGAGVFSARAVEVAGLFNRQSHEVDLVGDRVHLPAELGTQKLWMTSAAVISSCSGWSTGT
jgi:hypothetical protein